MELYEAVVLPAVSLDHCTAGRGLTLSDLETSSPIDIYLPMRQQTVDSLKMHEMHWRRTLRPSLLVSYSVGLH